MKCLDNVLVRVDLESRHEVSIHKLMLFVFIRNECPEVEPVVRRSARLQGKPSAAESKPVVITRRGRRERRGKNEEHPPAAKKVCVTLTQYCNSRNFVLFYF